MIAFIQTLLFRLLEMPEESFVILGIRGTENYVQFAGSSVEGLCFDFPTMQLDDGQKARASLFFRSRELDSEDLELTTEPDGEPAGSINSYNAFFEGDMESAAELAAGVLEAVFGVVDTERIEVEWS